jgi:hypothetical protein
MSDVAGTPDYEGAGIVPKRLTNFAAAIDFSTIAGAFTGLASQARFQLPREVLMVGAGNVVLIGIYAADPFLTCDVSQAGGLLVLRSRFVGIRAAADGTTLVGSVYVTW